MSDDAADRKIGLERFLQIEPQRSGTAAILRRKYAKDVRVLSDWEETVSSVLGRKTK